MFYQIWHLRISESCDDNAIQINIVIDKDFKINGNREGFDKYIKLRDKLEQLARSIRKNCLSRKLGETEEVFCGNHFSNLWTETVVEFTRNKHMKKFNKLHSEQHLKKNKQTKKKRKIVYKVSKFPVDETTNSVISKGFT